MSFPWGDWQFWVVTGVFLLAVLWIARGMLPGSAARRKKRTRRATLTVGGRPVK